jgi:RNA polymerase sigma-70 factor (ECF subfamily)
MPVALAMRYGARYGRALEGLIRMSTLRERRTSPHEGSDPTGREEEQDRALLLRYRHGEEAAFEALFRRYQPYVYRVCLGMLGNGEDAADVTQEVFLRLHRRPDSYRGDAALGTWLYRVAVNCCLDELRSRKQRALRFLEEVEFHTEEADPAVAERLVMAGEEQRAVRRILSTLPPDYRAVLVLRHFEQLSYEELCGVLGLSLPQAKTRLFRARRLFKERYEGYTRPGPA